MNVPLEYCSIITPSRKIHTIPYDVKRLMKSLYDEYYENQIFLRNVSFALSSNLSINQI